MMLTVEPGCYIRPGRRRARSVLEHRHPHRGRRRWSPRTGCEVLTAAAPKTVAEIEALMGDRANERDRWHDQRRRRRSPAAVRWARRSRSALARQRLRRYALRRRRARARANGRSARRRPVARQPPDSRAPRRVAALSPATPIERIHVSQRGGFGRTARCAPTSGRARARLRLPNRAPRWPTRWPRAVATLRLERACRMGAARRWRAGRRVNSTTANARSPRA